MKKIFLCFICALLTISFITGCETKKENKKDNNVKEEKETVEWVYPTDEEYEITVNYGKQDEVGDMHFGVDISAPVGSNVYATKDGKIIKKDYSEDLGNYIMIEHNDGYYSLYAHLSNFSDDIGIDANVSIGEIIGYVAQTGFTTKPHLHFQILTCENYWDNSCTVDPLDFINVN